MRLGGQGNQCKREGYATFCVDGIINYVTLCGLIVSLVTKSVTMWQATLAADTTPWFKNCLTANQSYSGQACIEGDKSNKALMNLLQ